jgi:hypothetical protein
MGLESKFKEFAADNSYLSNYDQYELIGSRILLRLFFYKKGTNSGLLGPDGKPIEELDFNIKLIPVGKVIKLGTGVTDGYNHLKPGDIVHIADDISSVSLNPAWVEWMEHRDERPKIKTPQPQPFVGNISNWKQYMFVADKFAGEYTTEDLFTFAIPQNFIIGKMSV